MEEGPNDPILEKAKEILRTAYSEQEVEGIISQVPKEALTELEEVQTSTNEVERRKNLNEWVKRNKN